MRLGKNTVTQRALKWFSRPARWFRRPLGKLVKPLGKIDGIEKPAVYLGFAFLLWRLWVEQHRNQTASGRRPPPRRRPSLRLLVQERLNRAAGSRSDDQGPRPSA